MADLLPGGIRDERFVALQSIAEARFAALDLTRLLVMNVDEVDASALPALAWEFGTFGESWRAASTEAERRALLHRVLARRRRRGTPWAVLDALAAVGHVDACIVEDTTLLYDGSIGYDGLFTYSDGSPFRFWVILNAATVTVSDAALFGLITQWKRLSARCDAIFFVTGTPSADFYDRIVGFWPGDLLADDADVFLADDADAALLDA